MGRKSRSKQQGEQQSLVNDGTAIVEADREVWLPIDGGELAGQANELATVTIEINDLRDEKKAAATGFTERIKKLAEREKKLAQIVKSGTAPKILAVRQHFDYAHGQLVVERKDTGVEVERRTLTAEEMEGGDAGEADETANRLSGKMRCLDCGHEFERAGFYIPEHAYPCPECKAKSARDVDHLEHRDDAQGDVDPAEDAAARAAINGKTPDGSYDPFEGDEALPPAPEG